VKQKVSSGYVPDVSHHKEGDGTPPKGKGEDGYRVPGGHETEIDVCSTLQQMSTDQDTPKTRNKRENELKAHQVVGWKVLIDLRPSRRRAFRE
jgi:hypothetical protein